MVHRPRAPPVRNLRPRRLCPHRTRRPVHRLRHLLVMEAANGGHLMTEPVNPPAAAGPVIPADAVTAAAEAMEDAAMRWIGRDLGTIHRDTIAREALAAALPHLTGPLQA